ncbi:Protein asteroid 1 [Mactra antiquata]
MGVRGLLSTCLQRQEECTETIDLVDEAFNKSGIELIVDFYSFQQTLLQKFWTGLCQLRGNHYLRIIGGEYDTLDKYVKKLVSDLKSLGIHLVFYIDGSKGSSTEALRQKLDTWMKRHDDDVKKMTDILNVLWGNTSILDLPSDTNIRPVVLEDQFMAAIKQCECEIHQIPAGEADLLLIRALYEREKACAILSNDSDFCVFKNSKFIPMQLFDIENDLRLGEPAELPEKPLRLKVKVIRTEKVMSMLQLNSHPLFVEMCIAAGNDYTGPFMNDGLGKKLDVRGRLCIENYAGWIKHYKNIQNHPLLADEMHYNQHFRQAVYHSRNFYNLKAEPDQPPKKGYFSQIIEEGIRSGKLPCNIMGIHNNFYWYRMLLEDNSYGQPCAECALTSLRAYIYRIVLLRHENLVNEYGRSPYERMRKAGIIAVDDGLAPSIHRIIPDKIFQNLRTFHAIMCHQERGNCTRNWFDLYGRRNGFTMYLLRYFLMMNWGYNLHITENEYLALVAMVLGKAKESYYQCFVLKPTVRCVTILNWFQDLYRHAYSMLGSLLHLKHEFPLPSDLFSGSVWAMMYMVAQDDTFRMAANQLSMNYLYDAQAEMNKVIKEKRHIIRHIVDGFFPFDDR